MRIIQLAFYEKKILFRKQMETNKEFYTRVFFSSLKMLAQRGLSIIPYCEILERYDLEIAKRHQNLEFSIIEFEDLKNFINQTNMDNFNLKIDNLKKIEKLSYLSIDYQNGSYYLIFFYDDSNKVISSEEVARISSIIEDVSNNLHNEYKDSLGISHEDSYLNIIIITDCTINSFPRERLRVVKEIVFISTTQVLAEPFNHILQSETKPSTDETIKDLTQIKQNLPTALNDPYTSKYLGMKPGTITTVFRDSGNNSIDLHYRIVKVLK